MYEQVEKPKKNKSRTVANSVAQKRSNGKQGFGVVDNRTEAVAQRKLQEMANNSPQAKQAAQLQVISDCNLTQHQQPIQKKENNMLGDGMAGLNNETSTTAQLKPVLGEITWGVTHAVKEVNGSIYGDGEYEEGEIGEWGELTLGEVVTVDDDGLFMSRRGANQEFEKNRERDGQKKQPNVEWIRVMRIKGIDVEALNIYIRSETVHFGDDVLDPEAGWTKVGVTNMSWDDTKMLEGVEAIAKEYAEATKGRQINKSRNICSTPEMDQDDEGLDVANDFLLESCRDLSDYGPEAQTKVAHREGNVLIGVMQIAVQGEESDRYLYIKWLLGSRSSRGAGVALVRSALEYAIKNAIMKVKVESAMSAVAWYEKRGFSNVANAQHMNDKWENPIEDEEETIDCGCAEMELKFYWDNR